METTYNSHDLEKGKCTNCGEKSNEIVINDGNPYSGILYVLIVGFIIYQIYIKKLINK